VGAAGTAWAAGDGEDGDAGAAGGRVAAADGAAGAGAQAIARLRTRARIIPPRASATADLPSRGPVRPVVHFQVVGRIIVAATGERKP
jgi:hypothetical protein